MCDCDHDCALMMMMMMMMLSIFFSSLFFPSFKLHLSFFVFRFL